LADGGIGTGTWITFAFKGVRMCRNLCSAADTPVGEADPIELRRGRAIGFVPLALIANGPAPFEAEAIKLPNDVVGCTGHFSRWIDIVDPQQPLPGLLQTNEVACRCGEQRTEVKRAGG
jgi:hypothetical protein